MISKLFFAGQKAALYVKNHPQLLFVLILLVVIPLLFLYTGQQFLDVGKANQDRLQKDKIGLMHDTLASLLQATSFDVQIAEEALSRIAEQNTDIVDYKLVKKEGNEMFPVVSMFEDVLLEPEGEDQKNLYRSAALQSGASTIFLFYEDDVRLYGAYRALESAAGESYFLYTLVSLEQTDALFKSREKSAYFSLVFVYCFIIALAYWHIRLTDYRFLYINAQKSNEMKDLFTNMIAHELRAPLTAISGYAEIIEDEVKSQAEKEHARRIKESSTRLIAIVNDLLDVARIQSGKLAVVVEEVEVSLVTKKVLAELAVSAHAKDIVLTHTGTEVPHMVHADGKRLFQALTNLVSNAIKYTEKGTITLSVEEKHAFVEIRVKDTGIVIEADDQKKLFAPFFRVQNSDVSKITGSGLGMWITKELIELMGATIGVESIKGVGTHVVITLPKEIRVS
jgi:signal transduction histidine kinase